MHTSRVRPGAARLTASAAICAAFGATVLATGLLLTTTGARAADLTSSYEWKPIRIGAGGWADGMIVSETNPSHRFVRTDTGQAYRWDAAKAEWMPMVVKNADGSGLPTSVVPSPSHPFGANPRSFALDPNDNNILYLYLRLGNANTYGSKPFNVYKSTNGGKDFVETNFKTAAGFTTSDKDEPSARFRYNGERLAVDPNNSSVVYIGTGTKGLFTSTNAGVDWNAVSGGGVPTGDVDIINVLPYKNGGTTVVQNVTRSRVLYLVTGTGNVYRSANGGQNYTNITSGVGPVGKCQQATLDQHNGILYVPTTGKNLWKYSAGAWSQIKTGGCSSVTVDPNNSNRLFSVNGGGGQVSRSLNGGGSWTNLGFSWAGTLGFSGTSHPAWRSVAKILMDKNGYVWQVEGNDGVFKWLSNDATNAASWTPDCKGVENFCAMDINFPKGGGDKVIVSVQDENGLVITNLDTFSIKWIAPQSNLANATTVAVCPNDPNTFVIVSRDQYTGTGSWSGISTNGGTNYTTFKSMGALPSDLTTGGNLSISRRGDWGAGSDHLVWLGGQGNATNPPYYSKNGGGTWTASTNVFGTNSIRHNDWGTAMDRELVADPFVPDKHYVNFVSGGFWVTTNGGVTWTQRVSPGSGGSGGTVLCANDKVQDDLWLLAGGLNHSTNGGVSWTNLTGVSAGKTSA